MDPKSKLANTILQKSVIKTILENNCDKGEMDVFLTKTILANSDKEVTVQEFFNVIDKYGFHWTDTTPRRIKDYTRKMLK
jgi:hypothetical protein